MMAAADTTTVLISVLTGGLAGLLASVVGQILLGDRPWLQVKAFHDVQFDRESGEVAVRSYVRVANVRGRPVRIEHVAILQPGKMSTPRGWPEGLPTTLSEGTVIRPTFDRTEYPNAVPVAIDSAGRVWPRRRWWRARRRAMLGAGPAGVLGVW